jgi:hypothetical protein
MKWSGSGKLLEGGASMFKEGCASRIWRGSLFKTYKTVDLVVSAGGSLLALK